MDSPKLKTISHDFLLDKMRVFYSRYMQSGFVTTSLEIVQVFEAYKSLRYSSDTNSLH
jgi:hypothetical protein